MIDQLVVEVPSPLVHSWISSNRLLVYSKRHANAPSHEVKWGVSMSANEFMRRLCKSSFDLFCALQQTTGENRFVKSSMQYRAALAACSQEMLQFLKLYPELEEPKMMHVSAECELIQGLELIWHLAELIFIQAFPPGDLAYNLCSWFHVQSQDAADDARLLIDESNANRSRFRAEEDERYWPTFLALVLQVRSHEAASVLAIHSHANCRALKSLRQVLVAMPLISHTRFRGGRSYDGFERAWHFWQSECHQRISTGDLEYTSGDPNSRDYVALVCSILAGNPNVWADERIIQASGGPQAWYFRFVSFLFYTNQFVAVDGLSDQLDRWSSSFSDPISEEDSPLDKVIDLLVSSIFRLDLHSFVRVSSEKLENWWLVAHFTNLLKHAYPDLHIRSESPLQSSIKCDNVESTEITTDLSRSLSDFFLIGYAESLASDPSLFTIALGYLDFCQSASEMQSTLLLHHATPISTRAINWFISQAKSRNLPGVAEQLANITARRFLRTASEETLTEHITVRPNLPYSNCITLGWAFLAKNDGLINRLAEQTLTRDAGFRMMRNQTHNNVPVPTETAEMAAIVLSSYSDRDFDPSTESENRQLSPELAFLIRYAELQHCFHDGNAENAIDRLLDLLVTGSGDGGAFTINPAQSRATSSTVVCSPISTHLRLRLLTEVRHFLGRNRIRRDQIELLITAVVELHAELGTHCTGANNDKDLHSLLSQIHIQLARELASNILVSNNDDNRVVNTMNSAISPTLTPDLVN